MKGTLQAQVQSFFAANPPVWAERAPCIDVEGSEATLARYRGRCMLRAEAGELRQEPAWQTAPTSHDQTAKQMI